MTRHAFVAAVALFSAATALGADKALTLSGSGSESDPWLITGAADLMELAQACNTPNSGSSYTTSNANHYDGKYFRITADIDLKDSGFRGIAVAADGIAPSANCYFGGNIDGGGHTISNMCIEGAKFDSSTGKVLAANASGSRKWVGFVGNLGKSAMTQPASVRNLTFDASCSISSYGDCGTVAGKMFKLATVENVVSHATIVSYNSTSGGIAGSMASAAAMPSTIRSCAFYGSLTEVGKAGGIVGDLGANGVVADCLMAGRVQSGNWSGQQASQSATAANYVGGIAGSNAGSITGSMATGRVLAGQWIDYTGSSTLKWGQYMGAVAGSNSGLIANCAAAIPVEGRQGFVGAICGTNTGKKTDTADKGVRDCVAWGYAASEQAATTGAVCGRGASSATGAATGTFERVYYDKTLRGTAAVGGESYAGVEGLSTAALTAGISPGDLDADYWIFEAGRYPILAKLDRAAQLAAASTYLVMPEGMTATDFHGRASVSTAMPGITVSVADGTWFEVSDGGTAIDTRDPAGENRSTLATLTCGDFIQRYMLTQKPVLYAGAGTQADPYLISTPADLVTLATVTSRDDNPEHYPDTYFRITADLDMAGSGFTGIASAVYTAKYRPIEKYYFSGHIDGGGHSVSNISIHGAKFGADGSLLGYADATSPSTNAVGFIGNLGNGASVRNLHIVSAEIDAYQYAGGIAALADRHATIENCTFDGTVKAYSQWAGGILGFNITKPTTDDEVMRIASCRVSGRIEAESTAGGIFAAGYAVAEGCVNLADVSAAKLYAGSKATAHEYAGGIAGTNSGTITGSLNLGTVSATAKAGGIAGEVAGSWKGHVTGCVGAGIVLDTSDEGAATIGAIIGYTPRIGNISITGNCFDVQYSPLSPFPGQSAEGLTAADTEALTGATLPDMLDGEAWTARAGFYPVPSAFAGDGMVSAAAVTFVYFGAGQNIDNMMFPATINTAMPLTATVSGAGAFTVADGKVSCGAVDAPTEAVLTLMCGDKYTRSMTLRKIPYALPGSGTAADPFVIATADDWDTFAASMLDNKYNYLGTYVALDADIDFTGRTYHRIGSPALSFEGNFDGRGHTVEGVRMPIPTATEGEGDAAVTKELPTTHAGLFAIIGEHATVKGLTIDASYFAAHGRAGALAGECGGAVSGITVGHTVTINVTEYDSTEPPLTFNRAPYRGYYGGGVAGYATPQASFTDCINRAGTIDDDRNLTDGIRAMRYAGGIVGGSDINAASPRITDCANYGYIAATGPREEKINTSTGEVTLEYVNVYAGGIAGMFSGTVSGCSNYGGAFAILNQCAGGILGHSGTSSLVEDCHNYGIAYTAWMYAGGIVGVTGSKMNTSTGIAVVQDCHNEGSVETAMSAAGGIAGQVGWASEIRRCTNAADITVPSSMAGGIAAQALVGADLSGCLNTGAVTASSRASGILAMTGSVGGSADLAFVTACFNAGDVTATQTLGTAYASGIATQSTVVADCYNAGTITGASGVGGIAGSGDDMWILRSFNLGKIVHLADAVYGEPTEKAGNIIGTPLKDTGKVASVMPDFRAATVQCYYPDTHPTLPQDIDAAQAVSYTELMTDHTLLENSKGDTKYVYSPSCLPRLAGLEDSDAARAYASCYTPAEGNTASCITAPVTLSSLDRVTWTAGGLLSISGSTAVPDLTGPAGEATLTAGCGRYSVTYTLTVDGPAAGITDATACGDAVTPQYYNLQGISVETPQPGTVVIRRTGSRAEKILIR